VTKEFMGSALPGEERGLLTGALSEALAFRFRLQ
jgi:hypothetical protein